MSDLFYVAYGSNLSSARFRCYLRGGRPEGGRTDYPGCTDPRLRCESPRPVTIPHRLGFGRWSPRWEGGVAFVDPRPGSGHAFGAAWRVSWGQLADLCAQECTQARASAADHHAAAGLAAAMAGGRVRPGDRVRLRPSGWYAEALVLEPVGEVPAVTLTSVLPPDAHRPPAPAYLEHVRDGLCEVHRLDRPAADAYLDAAQRRSAA